MHISLDAYRVFYYVAQYQSFTKAAELLYSNQPNVTRTIKNLENALGCSLFVRTSRTVQLTPEGEDLLAHIAPAMEQIRSGEETIQLHSAMRSGIIRIGTSEIALHSILMPVLEQFRRAYPGIRLRIINSNTRQAVTSLKDRLVDFSLITPPADLPEQFLMTNLTTFQEVPICGRAYANAAGKELTLAELSAFPLISLCQGTSTRQLYAEWFREQGLPFSPDIEAATADQILPMVRGNLGIGFIPEKAAKEAAADGSVAILKLTQLPPQRSICLLKRKDTPLSIAAGKLEGMLLCYKP